MVKSTQEQRIIDALERCAAGHGVDVVDVEVTGATKAPCVRVRIEGLDGASFSLDEVTAHTSWVSDVIEELDPVPGAYTLEVSTPGIDRPLRRPSDFMRFAGQPCELTTCATTGRRRFKGVIAEAHEDGVTLELEGEDAQRFAYDDIKKCTLKPKIDFNRSERK